MSYAAEQALRTNWLMNSCKEPIEDQSKSVIKEQSAPLCFEQITKEQNLDPIHPVRKHLSKKAIKNTILFARALLDEMKMKQQDKQTFKKKRNLFLRAHLRESFMANRKELLRAQRPTETKVPQYQRL